MNGPSSQPSLSARGHRQSLVYLSPHRTYLCNTQLALCLYSSTDSSEGSGVKENGGGGRIWVVFLEIVFLLQPDNQFGFSKEIF